MKALSISVATISVALALAVTNADADLVITQKKVVEETDANEVRQPEEREVVIYMGDRRMRVDEGDRSTIARLDRKKAYIIDHEDRTIFEADLPIDRAQLMPSHMAQLQKLMSEDHREKPRTEISELDRAETWGPKDCHRRTVTVSSTAATMSMSVLSTHDVDEDGDGTIDRIIEWDEDEDHTVDRVARYDPEAYKKLMKAVYSTNTNTSAMTRKLLKLDGLPLAMSGTLRVHANELHIDVTTESIEEREVPPETYRPPEGYEPLPHLIMDPTVVEP